MTVMLALDEGTTSCRAILFDLEGNRLAVTAGGVPQIFPQPGWVEHDASVIFDVQRRMASEVLDTPGLDVSDLAGIGITNQRETVVLWDRHGCSSTTPSSGRISDSGSDAPLEGGRGHDPIEDGSSSRSLLLCKQVVVAA